MKFKLVRYEKGEINIPLIYFLVFSFSGLIAFALFRCGLLPTFKCQFKEFTGHPCPTCGTTRLVLSIFQFKIRDAFLFNPFMFVSGVIFGLWTLTGFLPLFFKKKLIVQFGKREKKVIVIIIAIMFLLNWAYLWIEGI